MSLAEVGSKADKQDNLKSKQERHLDNLRLLSGWWHGMWFWHGVAHPKSLTPRKIQNNKQGNNTPNVKR